MVYKNERLISDEEFERLDLLKSEFGHKIVSFLDNEKFLREVNNKNVTCIICRKEYISLLPEHIKGIILLDEPYIRFWRRHNELI